MGLDNGFILKTKNVVTVPPFVELFDYDFKDNEYEVVYWRKCWGLRGAVLDTLNVAEDGQYHIPIESEDIPALIRAIKPFFSKEYWERNGHSIWEFDEFFDNLVQTVLNLSWLQTYLDEHPDASCYFYDSY